MEEFKPRGSSYLRVVLNLVAPVDVAWPAALPGLMATSTSMEELRTSLYRRAPRTSPCKPLISNSGTAMFVIHLSQWLSL